MHRFEAILSSPRGGHDPWDHVLAESTSFVAFPSLGSLVAGWMLIVPRRPLLSLRELIAEERDELNDFSLQISAALAAFGGEPYLFEHGNTVRGGPVGCGVDQAHLHLVPLKFDLFDAVAENPDSNMEWTEHAGTASFTSIIPALGEYVSIWRPRDGRGLGGMMCKPQSQWIRRVIAAKLGRGNAWNYKVHPEMGNLLETVKVMSTAFPPKSCNPQLS